MGWNINPPVSWGASRVVFGQEPSEPLNQNCQNTTTRPEDDNSVMRFKYSALPTPTLMTLQLINNWDHVTVY